MALIGKNGVGKTNSLHGIEYATSQAFKGFIGDDKPHTLHKQFSAKFCFNHSEVDFEYDFKLLGKGPDYIHDSLKLINNGQKVEIFRKRNKSKLHLIEWDSPIYIPPQYSGLKYLIGIILSEKKTTKFLKRDF